MLLLIGFRLRIDFVHFLSFANLPSDVLKSEKKKKNKTFFFMNLKNEKFRFSFNNDLLGGGGAKK